MAFSRVSYAVASAAAACVLLGTAETHACSIAPPPEHEVVADPSDAVPPVAPTVRIVGLSRGSSGGCGGVGSCDDIAFLTLEVVTTDDVSPEEEIGVRVSVVGGALPDFAQPIDQAIRPTARQFDIIWVEQDAEDFVAQLSVVAVDRAGNVSAPTEIRVEDGSGCRVSSGRTTIGAGVVPVALVAAALIGRRRVRR